MEAAESDPRPICREVGRANWARNADKTDSAQGTPRRSEPDTCWKPSTSIDSHAVSLAQERHCRGSREEACWRWNIPYSLPVSVPTRTGQFGSATNQKNIPTSVICFTEDPIRRF
jgi:hypothetical protein